MTRRFFSFFLSLALVGMTSCAGSGTLGMTKVHTPFQFSLNGTPADYEPAAEEKEKDPAGQILVIVVGIAATVGAAVAIPLLLKK